MSIIRSYTELRRIPSFKERFEYLRLDDGHVGEDTFGYFRYMNQAFYHSTEWRSLRHHIITRDLGCDLGVEGYEIFGKIYIHHMNPITRAELEHGDRSILDPEFLICTSFDTHNAIHYGDATLLVSELIERRPYDTCPWKHN